MESYLAAERTGRGEPLGQNKRRELLQVFEQYQRRLQQIGQRDWEDIPIRVRELIDAGRISAPRYHAVLVDESQDFAPAWFRVILWMLRRETNLLFLVGDGAQRVYRRDLCWSQLGIPLRGRSRVLRRVYRNTVEIARYAAASIREHAAVAEDLAAYGEDWIEAEFDHPWARHGPEPVLMGFASREAERGFLVTEVRALLDRGRSPSDILVVQLRRDDGAITAQALKEAGLPAVIVKEEGLTFEPPAVNVCTYHSAKGLEFPVVFCSMIHLFPEGRRSDPRVGTSQREAEAARLLYVGMTRARDLLYVTYQSQ